MDDSRNTHALSARLEKLSEAYLTRLTLEFERLVEIAGQLANEPRCLEALQQLNSALHSLAGSAGTFGFVQLGRQAREQEQQVAKVLEQPSNDKQPLPVSEWIAQLQSALETDKSQKAAMGIETSRVENINGAPCIWLIERDAMLAEYMVQQLHSFGFQVRHFSDAKELDQDKTTTPDVLLIDHRATQQESLKINPVAFWQERLKDLTCPILFTGTEESFTARLHALRSGGSNYFVKPLDMIKLASYVAQLIKTKDTVPERVMVIENDVELAHHLQGVLEAANMQVMVLDHPGMLFEAINDFNPELILMDLWLQDVTGPELAALLGQMERWSQLPVIYLSGESNAELRGQALLKGGDAFLENLSIATY